MAFDQLATVRTTSRTKVRGREVCHTTALVDRVAGVGVQIAHLAPRDRVDEPVVAAQGWSAEPLDPRAQRRVGWRLVGGGRR